MSLPRYRVPRPFDVAYATFRDRVSGHRFIVGGDWNVSPELWLLYHPGSHDADFFARAAGDGWVDCYRRDHKHEGQTWFRSGNLPYQFDHVFCDETTGEAMSFSRIDPHPAACLRVSDHARVIVEFRI
jgi:exonuclease III